MAYAQKLEFVFRRNGRVHLNRRERQFSQLLAAEVCASAVVMLDTPCSEVVWRVMATHSIRQFLLHFPSHASPCAITFQLESTTSQYHTVTVTATVDIQTTLHMLRSKVKLMRSLRGCRLVFSRFGKLYSEQRLQSFPSSLGTYHCRKRKRVSKAKIAPASQIFGPMKLFVLLYGFKGTEMRWPPVIQRSHKVPCEADGSKLELEGHTNSMATSKTRSFVF